ncbi:MAG: hypothetical protein LH470_03100 [Lysobacter sp.]|nr:hypothetical protein [Lysobacter sp.]
MKHSILFSAVGMVAALSAAPAYAASELVQNTNTATAICQGSSGNQEKLVKRPLGIINNGDVPTLVSCSFTTSKTDPQNRIVEYFGAFFSNETARMATVTCTGVQGLEGESNNVYETQSVGVLPHGRPGTPTTGYIFFGRSSTSDPLLYQNVAMSCQLPPGVSINDTYVGFYLDDAT